MKNKNIEDQKYKLEIEVIEIKEQTQPQRMVKIAKKSLKKMILSRINGQTGEC